MSREHKYCLIVLPVAQTLLDTDIWLYIYIYTYIYIYIHIYNIIDVSWEQLPVLEPWFCGFTGAIVPLPSGEGFETRGVVKTVIDQGSGNEHKGVSLAVHVSELPIGRWTDDFQATLNKLCQEGGGGRGKEGDLALVDSYSHNNSEAVVDTTVSFTRAAETVTHICTHTHTHTHAH
jgi:hypothetical protein